MFPRSLLAALAVLLLVAAGGCSNNPYPPGERDRAVVYGVFTEEPKSLDPSYSYYAYEGAIVDVINLSFYQYHYLKRPVALELALGAEEPRRDPYRYQETVNGKSLQRTGEQWTFRLRPGVRFQDDPCFKATGGRGREVTAADVLYAFKRMADPTINCPVVSFIQDKILGYQEFFNRAQQRGEQKLPMDYTPAIDGLQLDPADPYVLRVRLNQPYPQLRFLMAMHFTTPIAHEAVETYGNDAYARHPVGCGPYILKEWLPKQRLVLEKNPNFFGQSYPTEGAPGDREAGLLEDAGKPLPLADRVVVNVVRETITGWNFFQQGYLDRWTVQTEQYQQALTPSRDLSPAMKRRGIRLTLAADPNIEYMAFNMNDPVVGGYTPEARKLRQAISLSIDSQELLDLQYGGFGTPAQFLIPPEVFGYDARYHNPYRVPYAERPLQRAARLLAEAGYPEGISRKTGQRLQINFENTAITAEQRQFVGLLLRQMQRLGIRVNSVASRLTVWRDKVDQGRFQTINTGWLMDYPDPENFVFLLYGPMRRPDGPNSANYDNPEYNRLFEQMRAMDDGPARQAIIEKMRAIAVEDCPWVFLYHDQRLILVMPWMHNVKSHPVANDAFKYYRVDGALRSRLRQEWNEPNYAAALGFVLFLVVGTIPAVYSTRRRRAVRGRKLS